MGVGAYRRSRNGIQDHLSGEPRGPPTVAGTAGYGATPAPTSVPPKGSFPPTAADCRPDTDGPQSTLGGHSLAPTATVRNAP